MIKQKTITFIVFVLSALLIFACQNPLDEKAEAENNLTPTVSFSTSAAKDAAISFQADVEVYSSTDRSIEPPTLINSYRISAKTIDNQVYTRIDIPGELFPDGKARAVINDGLEMRYINLSTMRTVGRTSIANDEVVGRMLQDFPSARTLADFFGNIDVPSIMNKYRTLSFDMTEENNGEGLSVSLPASYLTKLSREGFSYRSAKLYYDIESDTYAGSDAEVELSDGGILTVISRPVYESIEGILIKVGEINQKTYDYPETEADIESDIPQVATPEDMAVVTDEDLEALTENGATIMPTELILGDPNDPDYTITEISVYNDIKINTLDDSVFRIAE